MNTAADQPPSGAGGSRVISIRRPRRGRRRVCWDAGLEAAGGPVGAPGLTAAAGSSWTSQNKLAAPRRHSTDVLQQRFVWVRAWMRAVCGGRRERLRASVRAVPPLTSGRRSTGRAADSRAKGGDGAPAEIPRLRGCPEGRFAAGGQTHSPSGPWPTGTAARRPTPAMAAVAQFLPLLWRALVCEAMITQPGSPLCGS